MKVIGIPAFTPNGPTWTYLHVNMVISRGFVAVLVLVALFCNTIEGRWAPQAKLQPEVVSYSFNFVINAENILHLRMRSKRPSRTTSNNLRVAITDTGSSVVEEETVQS